MLGATLAWIQANVGRGTLTWVGTLAWDRATLTWVGTLAWDRATLTWVGTLACDRATLTWVGTLAWGGWHAGVGGHVGVRSGHADLGISRHMPFDTLDLKIYATEYEHDLML